MKVQLEPAEMELSAEELRDPVAPGTVLQAYSSLTL